MSQKVFQSQSLNDWLFYLEQQHPTEIELGLTRIQNVAEQANLTDLNAGKTVLVAGTNGKGTTIRFIELMLIQKGLKVGVFSSPHLFKYNERVRINGATLADQVHIDAFSYVESHKGQTSLTYFEFSTLAAFKIFQDQALDVVLIEVGLGGRLDSTNIIQQDISVITSIGLDHTDWLGDTVEKIAFEKAGIFKADNVAIVGEMNPPATIEQQARDLKVAKVKWSGKDFDFEKFDPNKDLWSFKSKGIQLNDLTSNFVPRQNVATAIQTLLELGLSLSTEEINNVTQVFSLPGRMQVVNRQPLRMVDVAHNPHAIQYLSSTLANNTVFNTKSDIHAVVGMMKDKDIESTLELLKDQVTHWHVGSLPGNQRAASATELETVLKKINVSNINVYDSITEAWLQAQKIQSDNGLLLGFGSFYTISDILHLEK